VAMSARESAVSIAAASVSAARSHGRRPSGLGCTVGSATAAAGLRRTGTVNFCSTSSQHGAGAGRHRQGRGGARAAAGLAAVVRGELVDIRDRYARAAIDTMPGHPAPDGTR
jgi:hypothetical protein